MAILNGTVFLLSIGGTALPDQTEGSISISMETRDITTKDSAGYRELLEGVRSGTISVSGLVDDDGAGGAGGVLFADLDSRTAQTLVFGFDDATDDYNYSCSAFCTSLEVSAATEDNVTYSATFEITGAITQTVA
jgi:TP901-1 family phage major tail protein